MKRKTRTVASISLQQLKRICDDVDARLTTAVSGVFAQKRTTAKAMAYIQTLSRDDITAKTCWDLAEAAGLEGPGQFQSLMCSNDWDHTQLWTVIERLASEELVCSDEDPLGPGIAVDETAQPKKGHHTAGVGVQYAGFAGGKVNCVTSVTMSLVTSTGSTWIANELFLQEKQWFTGETDKGTARREAAGIPEEVMFESKTEIARRLFAERRKLGLPIGYAAGDEVYGRSAALRKDHEDNGEAYAYFVPRDFVVDLPSGARVRADELLADAHGRFEVRACGPGLNGPRWYEWAMIATASPEHFLLIRQAVDADGPDPRPAGSSGDQDHHHDTPAADPKTTKLPPGTGLMYCHVPAKSPIAATLPNLVLMVGRRWPVEEAIAVGKGPIGWDENQFRKYTSVQRHAALCGLAMLRANMIRMRVEQAGKSSGAADRDRIPAGSRTSDAPESPTPGSGRSATGIQPPAEDETADECPIPLGEPATPRFPDEHCPPDVGFIRLSVAETLRLANLAKSPLFAVTTEFLLRWSRWRRRHQAVARWHHRRARLTAAATSP